MEDDSERQLAVLINKRERVFSRIQVLYDVSRRMTTQPALLSNFKIRCQNLKDWHTEFLKTHDDIQDLCLLRDVNYKPNNEAVNAFEDLFFEIQDAAAQLSVPVTDDKERAVKPKLPLMSLPKFNGDFADWTSFRDTYISLIHDNTTIRAIEKFHYLLSCLSGPAASVVRSLPLTEVNYSIAWQALLDQYDNKRIMANHLINKLFACTSVQKETLPELNRFMQTFHESVSALGALELPDVGDFLLLQLAMRRMPLEVCKRFEVRFVNKEIPTYLDFIHFVQDQITVLANSDSLSHVVEAKPKKTFAGPVNVQTTKPIERQRTGTCCAMCKGPHSLYKCNAFLELTPGERRNRIMQLRLCFNCLKDSHFATDCKSTSLCFVCRSRHHTLLHVREGNTAASFAAADASPDHTAALLGVSRAVLLGTAMVHVRDRSGSFQTVRALIDSGAQTSFITQYCAERLGLTVKKYCTALSGLGGLPVNDSKGVVTCDIKPRHKNSPIMQTTAIVLRKITTNMPSFQLPMSFRAKYKGLDLADCSFDFPSPIDLLIGADLFPYIYDGRSVKVDDGLPHAMFSIFGWVITGAISLTSSNAQNTLMAALDYSSLNDALKAFWKIEEIPHVNSQSPEDILCEQIFLEKHYRTDEGRYVVPLPLKPEMLNLGNSRLNAAKRLRNLCLRFKSNQSLFNDYAEFVNEYERLGHMRRVTSSTDLEVYFIPHHCVFKESSSTTKIRVVFDASAKTLNGVSLNDLSLTGPKLQKDITHMLINFRLHRYAFTADICKMYRQVLIRPEDRRFQHILWRRSLDDPVEEYELETVTYGVASSPYLAIRTIRQLVADEGSRFPLACAPLLNNTYMDDVLAGGDNLQETKSMMSEIIALLKLGGFELRKFSANHSLLTSDFPSDFCEKTVSFSDDSNVVSVLGIFWDPAIDCYGFKQSVDFGNVCSKRSILSHVARFFDPLGWAAPVVLRAKCFLQRLWLLGVGWDDSVPDHIQSEWMIFVGQLKSLSDIKISRHVSVSDVKKFTLLGFCDASELGYGAVIYLLAENNVGAKKLSLLMAKSKVAPLKTLSIPRLELCAATLLTKLVKHVVNSCSDFQGADIYTFTDSMTVLSWLRTPTYQLKSFVSNRVSHILETLEPCNWRYVPSSENPADCVSRGLLPQQILHHPLWWTGPAFCLLPRESWPSCRYDLIDDLPELKGSLDDVQCMIQAGEVDLGTLDRFSTLTNLQRVTSWCTRFITNVKLPLTLRVTGPLSVTELSNALTLWILRTQSFYFGNELLLIKSNKRLSKWLAGLTPFIDEFGVIRVGGRLRNSNLDFDSKHPCLLPKTGTLTRLVIDYFHKTYMHVGPRTLQSLISRSFWIISARRVIRSYVSKCVVCFRFNAKPSSPQMADLPASRVTAARPFLHVGVDFGGPFLIKESKRRNAKTNKAYICLFVCMSTKAIHLELVSDLSTDAFLASFNRFVARRGVCSAVYSDCGRNFVGAARHLSEVWRFFSRREVNDNLYHRLSERSITWNFNPPYASHFGGIWEAGIKSTKFHLSRVVGDRALTFEEFATVLARIEAILNSRPLCSLSTDPNELSVLTPGHFLIGTPLTAIPEYEFYSPENRLDRWQLVQSVSQHFWRRWQREYLHTLQQRSKWFTSEREIKVGDLVLIRDDNMPPLRWCVGRVLNCLPGRDGVVRVATVRTSHGELTRPVVKLCPLPID